MNEQELQPYFFERLEQLCKEARDPTLSAAERAMATSGFWNLVHSFKKYHRAFRCV